jgi:hypothetical protein
MCGCGIADTDSDDDGTPDCNDLCPDDPSTSGPCPVDCEVSNWSEWSLCSVECGGGIQTRTRTVMTEPQYGGTPCPPLTETQPCNEQPCSEDCIVSEWSAWSVCSAECGGGTQTRTRSILSPPSGGGTPCPPLTETQACNEQPCPVDCVVGEWSEWSTCSVDCGGGTQTRTREITIQPAHGGMECPVLSETQACNEQPCLPTAVNDLYARAKSGKISIVWTHTGAASYNVYRSDGGGPYGLVGNTTSTYSTYLDYGLTNNITYCYKVRAVNGTGTESADSNEACATPTDRIRRR